MAAVLLRAASLAFVMVLGILLKKTGIVGNPARVLRKVEKKKIYEVREDEDKISCSFRCGSSRLLCDLGSF